MRCIEHSGRYAAAGTTAAVLVALHCLLLAGCQRAAPSESAPAPSAPKKSAAAPTCQRPVSEAQYDAPDSVYAAYAAAINQSHWCEAIANFDEASAARVVLANFKNIALLAGSSNPKQSQYAAALKQFCVAHALDCADPGWLASFVPAAMNHGKLDVQLASVKRRAEEAPFAMYVEIMEVMQSVDATAMARLDPALANVERRGESATGMAQRAGGKAIRIHFVRTERGWKLSMPGS